MGNMIEPFDPQNVPFRISEEFIRCGISIGFVDMNEYSDVYRRYKCISFRCTTMRDKNWNIVNYPLMESCRTFSYPRLSYILLDYLNCPFRFEDGYIVVQYEEQYHSVSFRVPFIVDATINQVHSFLGAYAYVL